MGASSCGTHALVSDIASTLKALFAAERESRRIHDDLAVRAAQGRAAVVRELTRTIGEAKALSDEEEAGLRLVCAARLLGELEGDDVVDALIDVLDSPIPEARSEAGEQLQGLAYDRFKEVALGVERALGRLAEGSPALVELPHLIVEVPEGGVGKLLAMFLKHRDADAVGAAIEALVILGDPAAAKLLLPLQNDSRVSVIGEDDEQDEVTIGELATEALGMLQQRDDAQEG